MKIRSGSQVSLHFSISLESGDVLDSTWESRGQDKPAQLVVGDGNLPEGFENCLLGLVAQDKQRFLITPELGFGQSNPSNKQRLARSSFDETLELSEGLVVSFADAGQQELPGVICAFDDKNVEVDFNHPLAGKNLLFEVEIISVAQVSPA